MSLSAYSCAGRAQRRQVVAHDTICTSVGVKAVVPDVRRVPFGSSRPSRRRRVLVLHPTRRATSSKGTSASRPRITSHVVAASLGHESTTTTLQSYAAPGSNGIEPSAA